MTGTKNIWYFIVNPRAGSGKAMSAWVPAEKKLQNLGIPFETAMTSHKFHASELAHDAAAAGYRRIIAVGGDGSLHECFNGIMRYCDENGAASEEFLLGVVPIGSGNDWIKSMGVPNDVDKVLALIANESAGEMDVTKVTGAGGKTVYFANGCGTGFDAHVCSRVNRQKEQGMRGKLIYLDALRYTISHLTPLNIKLLADGKEVFEGLCYSLAVGNGRYSGSGMRQVPLAEPDDGLLDYMIVPKVALRSILKDLPRLFNGTVNESSVVLSGRCRCLQPVPLDAASEDIVELDGEIECRLPASIEVDGRRIRVIKG